MGLELLFALLPVAALSGWWVGRRSRRRRDRADGPGRLSSDYFKGLNYLLNEQPDKAIEVFVHMIELDHETVETHFALGNLFLRRGEVDRAIRIHQNLIARPTLTREQRNQALYELGRDYMRAGLLDRAESLLLELVDDSDYGASALRQLVDIYQQEKEWAKAVEAAQRLDGRGNRHMRAMIAQFLCERVEASIQGGELRQAQKLLKRALSEDKSCVRASLLEGRLHCIGDNPKAALRAYRRVEQQDPDFLPEVIEPVKACLESLNRPGDIIAYLRQLLHEHESTTVALALVEQIHGQDGAEAALVFLTDYLARHPSIKGMARFIELKRQCDAAGHDDLAILEQLVDGILRDKPVYKCGNCGFTGKSLHWQCPGCKQWGVIKPIHGIEGE